MAYGNIDGSGTSLVVADPGAPVLRVFVDDPLAGLKMEFSVGTGEIVAAVEIAQFLSDELPEIAVLLVASDGTSTVQLYRHNGTTLTPVGSAVSVGSYATGLASGHVNGVEVAALVVTSRGANPEAGGELRIVSWDTSGAPSVSDPHDTLRGPRGPSVGPVLPGGGIGIVVANSEETSNTISVFDAAGNFVSYQAVIAGSDAVAWDTAVGGFLPGGSPGVAVALRSDTSMNGVALFGIGASGLTQSQAPVQTDVAVASSALAVGDVAGSGAQVVVANAGRFSHTAGESVSPSVMTLATSVGALVIGETFWGGGTEMAGGAPAVAVVDLGPVGRSRHPASAVRGAHVSTETAGFERHAECVDCHNTHALTSEPRTADAPSIYGVIKGAWGLDLAATEPTLTAPAEYEYEVCFKCHASADNVAWGSSPRDIAAEFDSTSAHPVMGTEAELYCVNCHGNAGAGPKGPHVSSAAPLLSSPLISTPPVDPAMLCYQCHAKSLYHDGTDPVDDPVDGTGFRHGDTNLHVLHVSESEGYGLGCEACHLSHGSENEHLIRDGLDWLDLSTSGQCSAECHLGGTYAFATAGSTWTAQASGVIFILRSVQFMDADTGWVVGAGNTILRTTDGGVTWAPAASPGTPPRVLHDVHFVDSNRGWLAGNVGTIRRTVDGGVTWTVQTTGTSENLRSVYFASSSVGWAVGDAGIILATTDGGTTWATQNSGVVETLQSVYFADEDKGWAVGARIGGTGNGIVLTTTDGGATWAPQNSGVLRVLQDVWFSDLNKGWAVGNGGTIIATGDGGSTWTSLSSGVTDRLASVRFLNSKVGWAVGDSGRILATTNGGSSWAPQASGTVENLSSASFLNRREGWAVGGDGTILRYGFE